MNICTIGASYVGLVSAACLSDFGWNVTCVEKDADKLERLGRGEISIHEPGLDALVAKNTRAGRLHFTGELAGCAGDGCRHLERIQVSRALRAAPSPAEAFHNHS
jgi:UDPglucose 6-dehydrogenase